MSGLRPGGTHIDRRRGSGDSRTPGGIPALPGSVFDRLSTLATLGLLCLLATALALVGGVLPGAQALLAALAAGVMLMFAIEATRQRHRVAVHGLALLAFIAAGCTLLQAAPLGLATVNALGGPTTDRAIRAVVEVGVPDPWWSLSADPPATAGEAVHLFLFGLVLVVSASLAGRQRMGRWILVGVGMAGLAEVAIGAVSLLTGARDLLGLYDSPATRNGGFLTTLLNANNASGFLNLATFTFMSLALDARSPRERWLTGLAAAVTAAGSIATLSRAGGAILLTLALLLPLAFLAARNDAFRPVRPAIRALRLLLLAALGLVIMAGFEELLRQQGQGSLMPEQWRTKAGAWGPALILVGDHPIAGIGRGGFATAFSAYNDFAPGFRFDYAENGVLQALSDWGVPAGLAIAGTFAFLLGRLLLRSVRRKADLALSFGVLAVAAQNLVDFSLEVPGVALSVAAILGVLERRTAVPHPHAARSGHVRSRTVLACLAVGALVAIPIASWSGENDRREAYLRLEAAAADPVPGPGEESPVERVLRREVRLHPVDAHLAWLGGRLAAAEGRSGRAQALVRLSLALFPASLPACLAVAAIDALSHRPFEAIAFYQHALDLHPLRKTDVFLALDRSPLRPDSILDVFAGREALLQEYLAALHRNRRLDRLAVLLEARLRAAPDDPDRLERLARTYLDAARYGDAEPLATRLLALYPERAAGWYVQGQVHWAADQHLEALAMFREAGLRGGDADAGLGAARCLLLLRRWDDMDAEVGRLWPKVAKDRHRTAQVHLLLASKARMLGNPARALEELDLADRAFPNMAATALPRAMLYRERGQRQEAIREFERALKLDPTSQTARKALDELRRDLPPGSPLSP